MFKRIAILSAMAIALSTTAHAAVNDATIIGAWKSKLAFVETQGMTIYMGLEFNQTTLTVSSICTFPDGSVLEPKVVVPVNVDAGKIQVMGNANAEQKSGGKTCNVNIETATVDYKVNNNILTLSGQGHSFDFDRR